MIFSTTDLPLSGKCPCPGTGGGDCNPHELFMDAEVFDVSGRNVAWLVTSGRGSASVSENNGKKLV